MLFGEHLDMSSVETSVIPERRVLSDKPTARADKIFYGLSRAAAYSAIVLVGLILTFLAWQAWPTFQEQGINFLIGSKWDNTGKTQVFQIFPMLWGSILISGIGAAIAIPMGLSLAYFIEFVAGKKLAAFVTSVVDLLAALPSVIIGLWGALVFTPVAVEWSKILNQYLGFIPIFSNTSGTFPGSPFIAGWIVAVMIVPIITSVSREVFSQIDRDLINGAVGLGAGRAAIFTKVILPTARGGVVGGVLLALGRALGETVAIYYVLTLTFKINWYEVLEGRGGSIASFIIGQFGEAEGKTISALMAAGVVLFVVSLLINFIAGWIVARAASKGKF
jgi:phosphate transport system permease protein